MSNDDQELEPIFKQKRILRSKVRKTLKSMDPTIRSQEDDVIQRIVLEAPWFQSCKRLCAYISCRALREVDTSKLLSQILHGQATYGNAQVAKKLYVPRVEDKNSHMRMFHISSLDDLVANSMDILEPAPVDFNGNEREDVIQANEPVDLFLLPGFAFEKSGKRLGRGGGYYDTFLTRYQELAKERNWRQPVLVALSYSLQILDEDIIPVTPNDVPVEALVTPSVCVVQIELYSNSLIRELPPGLSNLTKLRRFNASMNRLTGPMPDKLTRLPLEVSIFMSTDLKEL